MTETTQTLTAIEAINEFYRLKNKYETGYNEKYVSPIVKTNKPRKEKRLEYSRLPKPECINCKRNVGTFFTIKNDVKEDVKKFIAKCGDLTDPCPLDIQINYSIREQLYNTIIDGSKNIEDLKLDIIREKNNALFFNKDVVAVFEKITADLKIKTESVGFAIETNILRNNNPEKYLLIKKTVDEFGKGCLLPFKQMISNYMNTDNELVLNQAIQFYIDEMIPKLKEIQEMKYAVNFVEYNSENNIYTLIQYDNSLANNEFFVKSDDKVVKFIKGVKKNKKSKTMKTMEQASLLQNKTKKIRPTIELVIDEEEETELGLKEVEEIEETKETKDTKDINAYENIWQKIPNELKEILNMDKQWRDEYIQSCIIAKKERKPCEFFIPRQSKFPPTFLEDGKYDFGSEVVNKLFNSLEKSYQTRLLTLYSDKNGVRNYNMLKTTLADLLTRNMNNYNKNYF